MREEFIILLSIFIVVWLSVYLRTREEVEEFSALPSRKCTVWFTDDMEACNEGLFHKDTRIIQYMRDNMVGDMERQVAADKQKRNENMVIVNMYKGLPERGVRDKIFNTSSAIVAAEQAKLTNRNQGLIDYHQRFLNNLDWYARYYFRLVPQLEQENARLTNSINALESRIRNVKASTSYKNIDATLKIKASNPNFRCKNELHGWNEFNSSSDPADNDPTKKTSSTIRGNPYTWATCSKVLGSAGAKSEEQSYIENKKFPDIEVDNRPIAGLSDTQNAVTAQIRFHRFNQGDMFECDDRVTTPVMPGIPNGLFEVKVNNQDIVQSIRLIKYASDSRYIDANQTKNIGEVDGNRLQELFFDSIYEAWPTQQLYIYPKKGRDIAYRVHYVYYDNKCQRFFPNTTKPLGVSVAGDIMPNEPPLVVYHNDSLRYLFARSIQNKSVPTRYYINHRNPSGLPIFGVIRDGINREIIDMESLVNRTRGSLNYNAQLRNVYTGLYVRAPTQLQRCRSWRGGWNWRRARWNYHTHCWMEINWVHYYYKGRAEYYGRVVRDLENYINNNLIPQLNNLYNRRTTFNNYMTELDAAARAFSTNTLQAKLQSYVGKPANQLLGKYTPTYLSNNNTLFLQITSFSKATNTIITMDDTGRRVPTPQDPLTSYDILDEDTTYENVFTAEEIDPNNFLYIPESNYEMSEELKRLMQVSHVTFYNAAKDPINDFTEFGTFDLKESNIAENPAQYIEMVPGVRVVIRNGAGVTNTFDNSPQATANKQVELNSSMTGGSCEDTNSCLMNSITITKL